MTKDDKFQPDFDGFGLVVHDKDILVGTDEACDYSVRDALAGSGQSGEKGALLMPSSYLAFGFAPIYSEYKVGRSILNGGFASPTERATYFSLCA